MEAPKRDLNHKSIRVLIVDDHAGVRHGVRALLRHTDDIEVVGEATDGADAIVKARKLSPDVILMDVSMPVLDGIEATRRILAVDRRLRIIVLSAVREHEHMARQAGAVAHLLKDLAPGELIHGIRYAFARPPIS